VTTFFVVDIETSSTKPATGDILSIGVVAVNHLRHQIGEQYWRIDVNPIRWDRKTFLWWDEQPWEAKAEAYADSSLARILPQTVARLFSEFVLKLGGDDQRERVFCANPASFDFPWVDKFFADNDVDNPFHHKTLCLKSFDFGMNMKNWSTLERKHSPEIKHHALHDARAEALDLIDLLDHRLHRFPKD
jgi:hypothetical protein